MLINEYCHRIFSFARVEWEQSLLLRGLAPALHETRSYILGLATADVTSQFE